MSDETIKKEKERWKNSILKKHISQSPERDEVIFESPSGYKYDHLYTPADYPEGFEYLKDLGFPGQFPYTRGVQPNMYRGRLWTMRQYAGFGTAEESNKRYKYLLEQGQTGLSVAFDLPTQMGYDSDDPMSMGEVGRVGVAIDSLEDMEILFRDIPLDKVSTSMTINATAAILLAMYIVVAEKQGVPMEKLRGTIQNDILKEYIARGTYIFPPEPSMRIIAEICAFCKENRPRWNSISISGYHIREAGSTAVQEVAFTLADAITYIEYAIKKAGLQVDEFAPRLSFFFAAHTDFLEEIAKFRAARRLWAKIMKERFEAKNPKSMMMRFHTQTGGVTLTAQQPKNNIVRVTLQALAAVLGGTQSLHTNSYDEALALPTELSVMIALRTQQIIAEESGVANTVDPLAGSYVIEKLTSDIENAATDYIKKIDEMGGMLKAIENGFPQKEIHESAYRYQMEVEKNKRIVVGVNKFTMEEEPPVGEILKVNPEVEKKQIERLKKLKKNRDNQLVEQSLRKLKEAAKSDENLMPYIIEAVRNYTTIGEIIKVLKEVFGTYTPSVDIF